LVDKQLLAKSLDWKYEKEERVIDHERGHGIHKYRRDEILASVISGMRMDKSVFKILESAVLQVSQASSLPNLQVFQAEEVKNKYQLTVPGHPRLDRGNKNCVGRVTFFFKQSILPWR